MNKRRASFDFSIAHSERRSGWIHFGMLLPLPADCTPEFRAGYEEHRRDVHCRTSNGARLERAA